MRRLIASIALPLAGVLYPFVVYFGTEKVAPPIFALVLGAIWLIRAPSLLRQPGGRWMMGIALLYCVLLVFTGEADRVIADRVREAGGDGLVLKAGLLDELLGTTRRVAAGEQSFDIEPLER